MFTLEKIVRFEAAHVLEGHDGKCARLHGHSWVATVRLSGERLIEGGPKAGMLADFSDVKACVAPLVEEYLDHHFLNSTLGTDRPTSEFIARWLYGRLRATCLGDLLDSVSVEETCTSSATYREGAAR